MDKVKIFLSGLGILVVGIIVAVILNGSSTAKIPDGKYDQFAQCLTDAGAVFYGTFWCPHCRNQKEMFGSSVKLLPYVECSTLDGNGQTQICKDKNITGYPTWEFVDGSRLSGTVPLPTLAEKTGCELPAGEVLVPIEEGGSSVTGEEINSDVAPE